MKKEEHDPVCPRAKVQAEWKPCICGPLRAARRQEHQDIGIWLSVQSQTARQSPRGLHPSIFTNTHAAALQWASAKVLDKDFDPRSR